MRWIFILVPFLSFGQVAFPGAKGFGANATGGRGGSVIKVTNLNDSGTGSFRAAVSGDLAKYIVFEVSGTIVTNSVIAIGENTTIAGETSFRNNGHGITISVQENHTAPMVQVNDNTIIRFMRFRRGASSTTEVSGDAVQIRGNDIILDHVSIGWGTDENVDIANCNGVTIQKYIISEGLRNSTHDEGSGIEPHSMGCIIGGDAKNISFIDGLWAHNSARNFLSGNTGTGTQIIEMVNYVVYNYENFGTQINNDAQTENFNLINGVYIRGVNSSSNRYSLMLADNAMLYVDEVYNIYRDDPADDDWDAVGTVTTGTPTAQSTLYQSLSAYTSPENETTPKTRAETISYVLSDIGANLFIDAVDNRVIADVENLTGAIIDDPSEVGGWPTLSNMSTVPYDSDGDGMPDQYEDANGHDSTTADATADDDSDGYENIEEYFHSLVYSGEAGGIGGISGQPTGSLPALLSKKGKIIVN